MNTRTLIIVALSAFAAPAMATTFVAQYAGPRTSGPATALPSPLPPGLYVQVIDGLINVTNKGGAQQFSAGQFGFTPNPVAVPVIVPKNPGIQFTLPPTFSALPAPNAPTQAKQSSVDCEVR